MKINIYIRNDIDMCLGKLCAQCSHALNKALLNRMFYRFNNGEAILSPTDELASVINDFENTTVCLTFCDKEMVLLLAESPDSFIEDLGLTTFNKPTITVSWSAPSFGQLVDIEHRCPFKTSRLTHKQAIFVNRSSPQLNKYNVIQNVAKSSSFLILNHYDSILNQISLNENSDLLTWLQNGFGKTVVGCKRTLDYEKAIKLLIKEEKLNLNQYKSSANNAITAFIPMRSICVEKHTKTKRIRLLNSL